MSAIKTLFRRCPNCGRLFEIRIIGKKLADEKIVTNKFERAPQDTALIGGRVVLPVPSLMSEGVVIVDEKEFQYSYECKHCGHKWLELVKKDDMSVSPNGYDP